MTTLDDIPPGDGASEAHSVMTAPTPRKGAKHRMMKVSILSTLRDAGEAGMTATEVARKLSLPRTRVQAWFSGSGKTITGLEKIGPAHWRYTGSVESP